MSNQPSFVSTIPETTEVVMQAFLLERLYPTGWRRSGELYWRLSEAERESLRAMQEQNVRGVRVLSVRINPDAVLELMADSLGGTNDEK